RVAAVAHGVARLVELELRVAEDGHRTDGRVRDNVSVAYALDRTRPRPRPDAPGDPARREIDDGDGRPDARRGTRGRPRRTAQRRGRGDEERAPVHGWSTADRAAEVPGTRTTAAGCRPRPRRSRSAPRARHGSAPQGTQPRGSFRA